MARQKAALLRIHEINPEHPVIHAHNNRTVFSVCGLCQVDMREYRNGNRFHLKFQGDSSGPEEFEDSVCDVTLILRE